MNETAPVGVVYEVIPFGIGGNGTLANLQYLVAYGLNFQPDLVIDAFNTSDLDNDAFTTNLDAKIEALRNQTAHSGGDGSLPFKDRLKFWTKKVLKHSIVAVTVYSKYLSFKSWGNEQESLSEGAPLVEQKFSATSTKEIERFPGESIQDTCCHAGVFRAGRS